MYITAQWSCDDLVTKKNVIHVILIQDYDIPHKDKNTYFILYNSKLPKNGKKKYSNMLLE